MVYALLMDDVEHEHFLKTLEEEFPDGIDDSAGAPTPAFLARVREAAGIEMLSGLARSSLLKEPPDGLPAPDAAIRHAAPAPGVERVAIAGPGGSGPRTDRA